MLEEWNFHQKKSDEGECKARLKARRLDLAGLQQPIKGAGLPVIVLIEGWGAAGKGSVIRSLIRELDPRGFLVRSVTMPTAEERRWPFLKRHFEAIPEEGKILFLDSGWMDETVRERLRGDLSDGEYQRRLESVNLFERQLAAGGYLLVKLFLHIEQDTQRKRLEKLEELTSSFPGVEKAYAIQAGREVRIMVKPEEVSEDNMIILARDIAKKIENELEYPGQIKVNLIRETKAVEYAK